MSDSKLEYALNQLHASGLCPKYTILRGSEKPFHQANLKYSSASKIVLSVHYDLIDTIVTSGRLSGALEICKKLSESCVLHGSILANTSMYSTSVTSDINAVPYKNSDTRLCVHHMITSGSYGSFVVESRLGGSRSRFRKVSRHSYINDALISLNEEIARIEGRLPLPDPFQFSINKYTTYESRSEQQCSPEVVNAARISATKVCGKYRIDKDHTIHRDDNGKWYLLQNKLLGSGTLKIIADPHANAWYEVRGEKHFVIHRDRYSRFTSREKRILNCRDMELITEAINAQNT